MNVPAAMGIYLQNLRPMAETPKKAAKICLDHGVSHVAMFAVMQDRKGLNPPDTIDTMRRYSDAFRYAEVEVWIWGFPYDGREAEFVDAMMVVSDAIHPAGWILDPEVSYKWRTPAEKTKKKDAATTLVKLTLDALDESLGVVMTSYGLPSFHKNFPWKELVIGLGQPQLYLPEIASSKEAARLVNRGIAEWVKIFGQAELVSAVPAFGKQAQSGARLHEFLSYFVDEQEPIQGMTVWSWPQVSPEEWRIIARWADWWTKGIMG